MNEKEISPFQLVSRHSKLAIMIVASCIGIAGLLTVLMPRRYESHVKFLVNHVRADLVIAPGSNQTSAAPSEVTEIQVNSEIELLRSHDLLENIVRDQKLYLPFASNKSAEPSRKSVALAGIKLEKALDIAALRKTNIIDVAYRNADPDLAVAVLQDLSERYLTSHLAAHSAPGTDKFFTKQVEKYGADLTRARIALAAFHQQKHLFSMSQQQTAVVERFQSAESQLKDVDAQIQEQQTRQGENGRLLSGTSERVVTQVKQVSNQNAIQQLEPMLAQLENHRIELTTKFKPTDRLVTELDRQIANTKTELARIRSERTDEQTTDLNTLYQGLNAQYAKGQIESMALQTRRHELADMRMSYLRQLGDMDQSYVQLQNLDQDEKEASENYLLYTHRLNEARLAEALDREKFSNVVIIEKPVSSPLPDSPKLGLNLAIGTLLGIFLSLGIAFVLESRPADREIPSTSGSIPGGLFPARAYQPASGD